MDSSSMYKEHILELWKEPENFRPITSATHERRGFNQSCGDDITVYLLVKDGKVADASFEGKGCALCFASASLATEKIKGMNTEDVLKLGSKDLLKLLEIEVHPARLKCILLPLESMQKSIREGENKKR